VVKHTPIKNSKLKTQNKNIRISKKFPFCILQQTHTTLTKQKNPYISIPFLNSPSTTTIPKNAQ